MFRKNRGRSSVPRLSQVSAGRIERVQSQWSAATQPVAMLPNGAKVVFNVHYQDSSNPGLTIDWNPSADPESLVDVAIDELSFALDFQTTPHKFAQPFQHALVSQSGGIRWNPRIGRSLDDPESRIEREFGDSVRVLCSQWGALRQGLRMWSLHLTDNHLYVLSEGRDDYRHRLPLSNVVEVLTSSSREWHVSEWVNEADERERIPSEERPPGHSDVRTIGFFKLNQDPGWERFTEAIVEAISKVLPSQRRILQMYDNPPVEFVFVRTAKGTLVCPSQSAGLQVFRDCYIGRDEVTDWIREGRESLGEWREF